MSKFVHVKFSKDLRKTRIIPSLCATLMACCGLLFVLQPARAEEMSFQLVPIGSQPQCGSNCPVVIAAEGQITDETPGVFVSFVQSNLWRNNLHAVVLLDSPGGKVAASMELGRAFRRIGAAAIVARADPAGGFNAEYAGQCLSACVYALIGAKKRVIPRASEVGIHRMFAYVDGVDARGEEGRYRLYDNGEMRTLLSRYTGMMGVSPGLITMAEHISSDHIHILTRSEIARFRLGSARF